MKKLLLASVIAAVSFSTAHAAPTVYGKIFLAADYVDSELDWSEEFIASDNARIAEENILISANGGEPLPLRSDLNDDSIKLNSYASRIGFKGSEPMTAATDVTYQLEYGIDVDGDSADTFTQRTSYLGLKNASFGEVRVGNQLTPLHYINNVTVTKGYWDNLGSHHSEPTLSKAFNMADTGRRNNSVFWMAPKFDGIPVAVTAMYQTDEGDGDEGYGASIKYDQGTGFTVGFAYEDDLAIAGDIMRGTVSYDASNISGLPLKVGAMYQEADFNNNNNDEKGFVLSAEMGVNSFAKPASVYAQYNHVNDLRGIKDLEADQFVVGGKYSYLKNMIGHAYAGYNNAENQNGESDLFAVGGGLEYIF